MDNDLAGKIKDLAAKIGYTACGITGAEPFEEFGRALDEMIRRFPETRELYEQMRRRADPRWNAAWARSIVVCVRRYGKYELPECAVGCIGRNYLADQRFAGCPDHKMPGQMREGLVRLGMRVKTGGVPDRWAGARAGVTRFGRNCFAYSEHGSWINVETWRVDAELPPDKPSLEPLCPENCTACIDACPTKALSEPFVMRMDRCIAYLTYHAPEPIEPDLWANMGRWIYGCDVCQEACPLNRGKWESIEKADWMKQVEEHLAPEALANMDQRTYENIIHPRFWYIPKDNLGRWHANARRALRPLLALRSPAWRGT